MSSIQTRKPMTKRVRRWYVVIAGGLVQAVGNDLNATLEIAGTVLLAHGHIEMHTYYAARRKTACVVAAADRYAAICTELRREFDLGFD